MEARRISTLSEDITRSGRRKSADSDEAEEETVYSMSGDPMSPTFGAMGQLRFGSDDTMEPIVSKPSIVLTPPSNTSTFHVIVEDMKENQDICTAWVNQDSFLLHTGIK